MPGGAILSTWLGRLPPSLSCQPALGNKRGMGKSFLEVRLDKQLKSSAKEVYLMVSDSQERAKTL